MISFRIRPAKLTDLAELIHLEEEFPGDRINRRSWHYLLRQAHAQCLVAESDCGIIGNLVLLYRCNSLKARLYSMIVNSQMRGQGLGKSLLQAAENSAIACGRKVIILEVRVDNYPAINLYRQLGYRDIGYLPNYYQDQMAAYRMSKSLVSTSI